MSQFTRILPVAATTAFLLAACGHEIKAPDLTKGGTVGSGATGGSSTGGTGGTTGGTGGGGSAGMSTGGSAGMVGEMCGPRTQTLVINDHDMMPGYWLPPGVKEAVAADIASMPVEDKIAQMQGIAGPAPGEKPSWDDIERSYDVPVGSATPTLRGYRYRDAGRGVNLDAGQDNRMSDGKDYSTVFPTESVRAASWDLDLEWRVGKVMGDETAGTKNNMLLAPCMNIIRHPYWGRTQETYSEDMFHTGRMATALTAGIQQHVVACAKHFAANNVERVRKNQNAIMSEQTLREIYGRHFDMVINDGGIGCIMASYNKVNGTKATQNRHLLTEVLRDDFKYQGVVLSDWWAMPGDNAAYQNTDTQFLQQTAADAVKAGLDIEVPWTIYYGQLGAINGTLINLDDINKAAARVLEQKYRFSTTDPLGPWGINNPVTTLGSSAGPASVDMPDHRALTEETLIKSAVLLANGPKDGSMPMLPWGDKANIAVVGINYAYVLETGTCPVTLASGKDGCTHQFGFEANLGDRGSSRVNGDPATTISAFEGFEMMKTAGLHGVTNVTNGVDATPVDAADVAVVVVGTTAGDEGEEYAIPAGGDRASLAFPGGGAQEALVTAVLDKMKPTVIIVESGSIMSLPWLDHRNQQQATIWAGYPGHNGGAALAKLIFGEANFSGKMPMAWPTQAQLDLQKFVDHPEDPNNYDTNMGYFFGYRFYDDLQAKGMFNTADLVFPFGHGLSYTKFEYSALEVPCTAVSKDALVDVNFTIKNTGSVAGQEVAMLFVAPPPKASDDVGERPVKELKGFIKTPVLMPMEEYPATIQMRVHDLRRWKPAGMNPTATTGEWVIDSGDYTLMVGKNAADADKSNPTVLAKTVTIQ